MSGSSPSDQASQWTVRTLPVTVARRVMVVDGVRYPISAIISPTSTRFSTSQEIIDQSPCVTGTWLLDSEGSAWAPITKPYKLVTLLSANDPTAGSSEGTLVAVVNDDAAARRAPWSAASVMALFRVSCKDCRTRCSHTCEVLRGTRQEMPNSSRISMVAHDVSSVLQAGSVWEPQVLDVSVIGVSAYQYVFWNPDTYPTVEDGSQTGSLDGIEGMITGLGKVDDQTVTDDRTLTEMLNQSVSGHAPASSWPGSIVIMERTRGVQS